MGNTIEKMRSKNIIEAPGRYRIEANPDSVFPKGKESVAEENPHSLTPRLLNARDAAVYVGVAEKTIRNWASAGRIPVVRFSRRCSRFDRSDLDRMIEKNKNSSLLDVRDTVNA